jgi:DNA repair exonuclease SbcCD ATPase subunit
VGVLQTVPTQLGRSSNRLLGLISTDSLNLFVLPQGQFDLFLKGKPEDRRKILSDLLDLDIYSSMMKRANEIAKEQDSRAKPLKVF